jgi:hypothetical protein
MPRVFMAFSLGVLCLTHPAVFDRGGLTVLSA